MNMRRFAPVEGNKEKTVGTYPQDRRHLKGFYPKPSAPFKPHLEATLANLENAHYRGQVLQSHIVMIQPATLLCASSADQVKICLCPKCRCKGVPRCAVVPCCQRDVQGRKLVLLAVKDL